jgi:hypothetical protein
MDKNAWDAITAISTAAAAVFTALMAWFTRKAILEGQDQRREANDRFAKTRRQDKQHHEDGFRPLLVLGPNGDNESIDRQSLLTVMPSGFGLLADCVLRNIGTGPALNIRLSVRGEGPEGFGPSCELSPLAASDTFKGREGHIKIGPVYTEAINRTDMQNLPNGLWVLVLEYEDIFGNPFYTMHAKERGKPWTTVGRGNPPSTTPHAIHTAQMHQFPTQRLSVHDAPDPPM